MSARDWQEPILRYAVSAVFVTAAATLCLSVGDVAVSATVGLLIAVVLTGAPTFLLWGREFEAASLARDRARARAQTTTWSGVSADSDEDDD